MRAPGAVAHMLGKSTGVPLICRLFCSHSSLHSCYGVTVCSTESQAQREAGNVDCLSCENQSHWKGSQECLALYLRGPRCFVPDPWKPEAAVGLPDDWTTTFWVAEQRWAFLMIMQNKCSGGTKTYVQKLSFIALPRRLELRGEWWVEISEAYSPAKTAGFSGGSPQHTSATGTQNSIITYASLMQLHKLCYFPAGRGPVVARHSSGSLRHSICVLYKDLQGI